MATVPWSSVRGPLFRRLAVLGALSGLLLHAPPALADFPADPPDDPDYDAAEESAPACDEHVAEQQYEFFSFMPACAPLAQDAEDASGNSIDVAWRDFTIGRPDVVIAYVEGGINWHAGGIDDMADKVFVNPGEMPAPTAADGFADNGDPWFNALDWPATPDHNGNGFVDAEDLIVEFSDGVDDDGNGFVDDISGWDFYTDQNNPSQNDSAYTHTNGQMRQAAALTDNGIGSAGICPLCTLLPMKAGAEALDRSDDLAQAWLYAGQFADVIVSVTADLGYSSFMEQAVEHLAHEGVVLVQASNDFNSTDHQGGMWWPHVLPGNAMVANSVGMSAAGVGIDAAAANLATTSYRVRSGFTSWGAHNDFTPAVQGGTTSEATPTVGGIVALLLSWGLDAAEMDLIDTPLTSWEAIQILRATASDVDDPTNPWPNQPGFDLQYGYGRSNVHRAMQAVADGDIPPVAIVESPRWFSIYDPTVVDDVVVSGIADATRSGGEFTWELQYGLGGEPLDGEFVTFASGTARGEQQVSGTFDLDDVPEEMWARPHALSQTKTYETNERYTVTFRLVVTDAEGRTGQDRRAIAVHHDEDWMAGFPRFLGTGGEGQSALADVGGLGHLQVVYADMDGIVHVMDPATGEELPGWPVAVEPTEVVAVPDGIDPRHEPTFAPIAVGDLENDGIVEVVVTTGTGRTYVFGADGTRRTGFPKTLDRGVEELPSPRPQEPFSRRPVLGAAAPPVLFDLDADGDLEILQSAWDGHVHAWHHDGADLEGWPVKVELPEDHQLGNGRSVLIGDEKISAAPVIADLDGDGDWELVVKTQYGETRGSGLQLNGANTIMAYHHDGTAVTGWPAVLETIAMFYGSAQEFVTEGAEMPAAADVDGDGDDEVGASALFAPGYLLEGDASLARVYAGPALDPTAFPDGAADELGDLLDGNLIDVPVSFTTAGAFGEFSGRLTWASPGSAGVSIASSLLFAGSGAPITNVERAFDAQTGATHPGFAAELQGLNFLGAPLFVDVDGDGGAEIVNGGDTSTIHAYVSGGAQAEGFPKFTTGWDLWSPTAGDLDGDGDVELVDLTREGYLFVWDTPGDAEANTQWWRYKHDEWNTARYGTDTRPPGIPRDAVWDRDAGTVTFTVPGDDWYTGPLPELHLRFRRDGEVADIASHTTSAAFVPPGPSEGGFEAASRQTVEAPDGVWDSVEVWAVDDAGLRGRSVVLTRSSAEPATPPARPAPPAPLPTTGGAAAAIAGALVLVLLAAVRGRRRPA